MEQPALRQEISPDRETENQAKALNMTLVPA